MPNSKKKKPATRREYTRDDLKALKAHSKAKTPMTKISKQLAGRRQDRSGNQEQVGGRLDADDDVGDPGLGMLRKRPPTEATLEALMPR